MSGDLISLRLLLVSAVPSEQNLWRQAAALASVPIEYIAADAVAAGKALAAGGVDICVVDARLATNDCEAVLNAARVSAPAPFVAAVASGGASLNGADARFDKAASPEEARKLVELCIRTRMPTRVLVVDNSGTIRSIVRKILSASRFTLHVHEAEEGIAALNQLRSGSFGMVFLDYNMPGLNGIETLLEIKRETPNVAVVMMTSQMDNAIADRARSAGALAFLKKPFFPADIDSVLARYYGLSAS